MKSFGLTNIGNYRLKNDDSFYCSDGQKGIYIVADGMGGYKGGEIASKIAVNTAIRVLKNEHHLTPELSSRVVNSIQSDLQAEIKANTMLGDMGTTLIVCLSNDQNMSCLHIGDSRAYYYESGKLKQLTEDHTLVNILYKSGVIKKEELRSHPQRNILMKSITAYEKVEADFFQFELKEGSFLLLCSDGLTDHMTNRMIRQYFEENDDPAVIGQKLVEEALKLGGKDNIAVVVIKG